MWNWATVFLCKSDSAKLLFIASCAEISRLSVIEFLFKVTDSIGDRRRWSSNLHNSRTIFSPVSDYQVDDAEALFHNDYADSSVVSEGYFGRSRGHELIHLCML